MIILKPCPFCGGSAEVERIGTPRQSCIIACMDCGCRMESNETGDRCGILWSARIPTIETESNELIDYCRIELTNAAEMIIDRIIARLRERASKGGEP